jgi:DNA-binding transcriptional LysR family regulator
MELRHLRYFVVLAEELNFSRAAERLFMAQPPLSQQIAKLEAEIGVRLFERTNRRVALTPCGEAFLVEARHAIEAAQQAIEDARNVASGDIGNLRVAFGVSVAHLSPVIVDLIARDAPGIHLIVRQEYDCHAGAAVRGQDLDAAVVLGTPADYRLDGTVILKERWAVAVPVHSPLAHRKTVSIEDARQAEWMLGYGDGSEIFNRLMLEALQTIDQPVTRVANARTYGTPDWADNPRAASLVLASQDVDRRLVKVKLEESPPVWASLVWRRSTPALKTVRNLVVALAGSRRWIGRPEVVVTAVA